MTPDEYVASVPDERRPAIEAVRRTILANLPDGFEEVVQHGMLAYVVPLERYPKTYNKQPLVMAALANQKNHMAVYLTCAYADDGAASTFRQQWEATGRKLDMGKSCVRFKRLDDVPLAVLGDEIARTPLDAFITLYERSR
jgi:Domain of unknown function (DU1801)